MLGGSARLSGRFGDVMPRGIRGPLHHTNLSQLSGRVDMKAPAGRAGGHDPAGAVVS
jgi:hypothetical protein